MPTLVELATQIVTAQATASALSTDDIISSLNRIHTTLGQLESGVVSVVTKDAVDLAQKREPVVEIEKSFRKNHVVCLLCGKPFKSLGTHLSLSHGMTSKQYRQEFGIAKNQPLSSKVHFEIRQKNVLAKVAQMAKGKAARAQKMKEGREAVAATDAVSAASDESPVTVATEGVRKVGRPRKKKFSDYIKTP